MVLQEYVLPPTTLSTPDTWLPGRQSLSMPEATAAWWRMFSQTDSLMATLAPRMAWRARMARSTFVLYSSLHIVPTIRRRCIFRPSLFWRAPAGYTIWIPRDAKCN